MHSDMFYGLIMRTGNSHIPCRQHYHTQLGNAIPDRFANPGISALSLLNPGINPGIESSQIMAGYSGLVIGKIATTRTTRYKLNCAMHIVIGRLSCAFLHWRMVLFSVYCVVLCVNTYS